MVTDEVLFLLDLILIWNLKNLNTKKMTNRSAYNVITFAATGTAEMFLILNTNKRAICK